MNITAVSNNDMCRAETQQNNERGRGWEGLKTYRTTRKKVNLQWLIDGWSCGCWGGESAVARRWCCWSWTLDACCCGLKGDDWSLDVEEKNQKMQARRTRRMQHLREREIREKNRSRSKIAAAALEGLREREIRESE